jgi:di/tricarboxylate transporter
MSLAAWMTLAVLAVTLVVLARDLLAPALTVLGATVVLLIVGVLEPGEAFAGFANPAPITVAALFVLAKSAEVTGVLDPVIAGVLGKNGGSGSTRVVTRRLVRLLLPSAAASAVLNNTPLVAIAAPQVSQHARRQGFSPAPLLMPLSFAAILGGTITVIGTSTNLVVSGLMQESGQAPIGMLEIGRVGLPVAVVGLGLLVVLAPRLLPDRTAATDVFASGGREFTVAMRVVPGGPVDGRSLEQAGLRNLQGVYAVALEREGRIIAPVAPIERLAGEDVLTFIGRVDLIVDLQRTRGLVSAEQRQLDQLEGSGHTFFEAVIGPESPLVGHTLKGMEFRGRYHAAVLAIHRAGQRIDAQLGEVRLRVGDTLLLLADEDFRGRWRDSHDFVLVARLGGSSPARTRKAPIVGVVAVLLVVVAGAGLLPVLEAALAAALVLLATGTLTVREARRAVDMNVIVLIAAAFGLSAAMDKTGLAATLAEGLVAAFSPLGMVGALLAIIVATTLLTEALTNNAAAALMFPVAMSTAATVGASPRPFAIALAVAASASFLTPVGYQTNTMVYGLGGYRFTDYLRLGLPLNLTVTATAVLLIPLLWPL